jgi:hypothetical protein
MAIVRVCPSCGLESDEVRCPRCNALKVVGCSGVCSACSSSCAAGPVPAPPARVPSDEAAEAPDHPGTPLTR